MKTTNVDDSCAMVWRSWWFHKEINYRLTLTVFKLWAVKFKTADNRFKSVHNFLIVPLGNISQCQHSTAKMLKYSVVTALKHRGYTFGKAIGKGNFAFVIKATYSVSLGESVNLACKTVDKNNADEIFLEKFFPREIEILTRISHKNIIQLHSILEIDNLVCIFMRWAENGDLLGVMKERKRLSEPRAAFWFSQMASALKYIHSMNIAHRDLKCKKFQCLYQNYIKRVFIQGENILITENWNIKIADFGFSRECIGADRKKIMSETYCGSEGKQIF